MKDKTHNITKLLMYWKQKDFQLRLHVLHSKCVPYKRHTNWFFLLSKIEAEKRNRDTIKNWHTKKLWKFVNGKDGKWTDKTMQNEAMVMLIAHKYEWQSLSFVLRIKGRLLWHRILCKFVYLHGKFVEAETLCLTIM